MYKGKRLILIVLLLATFLRITQLGYSNFYGDETKALYYKKKNTPMEHFFNQRKGPGQFIVAWTIEKATGSYNELLLRLPSAIFGIASVYILYAYTKNLFDEKTALISAILLSLNGLYIAFSRILQYQSFYVFFGLLGLHLLNIYIKDNKSNKSLILSSISFGIGFLFHYDTIFFLIPAFGLFLLSNNINIQTIKKYTLKFALPLLTVIASYYLPYIIIGSFRYNTLPYLLNRVSGTDLRPSDNFYTMNFYNPLFSSFLYIPFSLLALKNLKNRNLLVILGWFIVPFILFQLVFSNPGTHIHNFILPLIILSAFGISSSIRKYKLIWSLFIIYSVFYLLIQSYVFVPFLNKGYPWKDTKILGFEIKKLRQDLQVFAYGFPYYRNWDEIANYLDHYDLGFPYYTNDNDTISKFYLRKFKLYNGRQTMFYIDINNNQLGDDVIDQRYTDESAYYPAQDFFHKSEKTATVYLRHKRNRF